jgi:putative (di)nucleoside polyphosphate hydrolase
MTPEQINALPYRPCVGIMLVNAANEVFTAQRLDSSANTWQMPQGGIDKGEAADVAALRELEEETGVTPNLVTILGETKGWFPYDLPHALVPKLWKGRYKGQEQKWFLMKFHGTDADIDIATEIPEFSKWRWTPSDQLVANIVPFKRDVYARVLQEFSPLL